MKRVRSKDRYLFKFVIYRVVRRGVHDHLKASEVAWITRLRSGRAGPLIDIARLEDEVRLDARNKVTATNLVKS
jgi:hypothetical protein